MEEDMHKFDQALAALPDDTSIVKELQENIQERIENCSVFSVITYIEHALIMSYYITLSAIFEFERLEQQTNRNTAIRVFRILGE